MLSQLLQRGFHYCCHTSLRWQESRRLRRSEKSLATLDSHLLADIGLTRVGDRTVASDKLDSQHSR